MGCGLYAGAAYTRVNTVIIMIIIIIIIIVIIIIIIIAIKGFIRDLLVKVYIVTLYFLCTLSMGKHLHLTNGAKTPEDVLDPKNQLHI